MPDFEAASDAILAQFKTSLDSSRPNVPVSWPNIEFAPAEDFDEASNEAWARVSVQGAGARQASLGAVGSRRCRSAGLVYVQVFAPIGVGANQALAVADDVATALRGVTASSVRLKAPSINPIGRDEGYYQVNVTTPFEFDQTA